RLHLQCTRRTGCRRRAVPDLRHPAVADHRGGGDGAVVGERGRQRVAAARSAAIAVWLSRAREQSFVPVFMSSTTSKTREGSMRKWRREAVLDVYNLVLGAFLFLSL